MLLAVILFWPTSLRFVGLGLLVLAGSAYLRAPFQRLPVVLENAAERGVFKLTAWTWIQAVIWAPLVRATGDIAKMVGYPAGWAWRLKNHPPDWWGD